MIYKALDGREYQWKSGDSLLLRKAVSQDLRALAKRLIASEEDNASPNMRTVVSVSARSFLRWAHIIEAANGIPRMACNALLAKTAIEIENFAAVHEDMHIMPHYFESIVDVIKEIQFEGAKAYFKEG